MIITDDMPTLYVKHCLGLVLADVNTSEKDSDYICQSIIDILSQQTRKLGGNAVANTKFQNDANNDELFVTGTAVRLPQKVLNSKYKN